MVQIVWNLEENAIFFAYDFGYNQQTIHIFVKAILLILFIFAFSGGFAKKERKKSSKKVFGIVVTKGIFGQLIILAVRDVLFQNIVDVREKERESSVITFRKGEGYWKLSTEVTVIMGWSDDEMRRDLGEDVRGERERLRRVVGTGLLLLYPHRLLRHQGAGRGVLL